MRFISMLAITAALAACGNNQGGIDASDAADAGSDVTDIAAPDVHDATVDTGPPPWLVPYVPSPRASFPPHFLWGSATAPYQIEGGLHNTDWYQWELAGRIATPDHADDGDHSYPNFQPDVDTLVATHQNAYRFGIEWARVFPSATAWAQCRAADAMPPSARHAMCAAAADSTGLAYYHQLLNALVAANITPLVTLQHYTLPTYINDLSLDWHTQGWMRSATVDDLAAWAGFVAAEFGNQVDWYVTLNEPMAFVLTAYLLGLHPPGEVLQTTAAPTVVANMIHAHVAMYDAIHANDTTIASTTSPLATPLAAAVSIAHNAPRLFPVDPTDSRDVAAAAHMDQLFNHTFWDAIVKGNFDQDLSGTLDAGEPMNDPMLRNRADYVGLNYYTTMFVQHSTVVPLLHALPANLGANHGLPRTDYGEDIYPRGLEDTLAWGAAYGLPLVMTENGIADRADVNRGRFLAEHLGAIAASIAAGHPVVGYFHWSNIDNFEWTAGFCPDFGLFSVDRTDPTRPRTMRPSASVYTAIIDANQVSDALLAAQPPYQDQTTYCAVFPTPDAGM